MGSKAKKASAQDPVDTLINKTIRAHADAARMKKELDERSRLAPRARIAKALYKALKKELAAQSLNGMHRTDARLAALCEESAKQLAKAVGLESSAKHS